MKNQNKSVLAFSKQYLLNEGFVYNIWCGLTSLWAYCLVCKSYTRQTPYQYKGQPGNEVYVCDECKCSARLVG